MELNKRNMKEAVCWIYGYTLRNVGIAEQMRQNGFVVKGYIDRRANKLSLNSSDLVLPRDTELCDKENDVLIILLLSVNSHLQVAKEMNGRGWKYILFMAVGNSYDDEYADEMRRMYNRLINLEFLGNFSVMEYTEGRSCKNDILRSYPDRVVVFVPVDLLFTDTEKHILEINAGRKTKTDIIARILRFSDKNIMRMRLYRDFFDAMLLGRSTASDYIKIYSALSGREESDYLKEREATLNIWEAEYLRVGMSYFIDGAAEVCYNSKGYFNILDGMHRLMYLIYKGNFDLPVTMSLEDYKKLTYIYAIRENGLKSREVYKRRLCFIKILDKLDSLRADNYMFSEAIVFAKNIYWAIVMKQNGIDSVKYVDTKKEARFTECDLLKQYNVDLLNEYQIKKMKNCVVYTDDEEILKYNQMLPTVCASGGVIFAYISIEAEFSIGRTEILYKDYEKKIVCYW